MIWSLYVIYRLGLIFKLWFPKDYGSILRFDPFETQVAFIEKIKKFKQVEIYLKFLIVFSFKYTAFYKYVFLAKTIVDKFSSLYIHYHPHSKLQ